MRTLRKLSDLEPCMNPACRGPLTRGFVVVHMSQALVNAAAANSVLGLHQHFASGGGPPAAAFALAEHFSPRSDEAVLVFGDKDPSLYTTVILCQDCWSTKDFNLAHLFDLAERRERARDQAAEKGASQ